MKIRYPLFVGLVAAFAVASIVASAVAAETPFKGTVSVVETGTTVFPTRFLDQEGMGTATYLGRYTEHVTLVINLPTLSSTGAATFTAANGDTLTADVVGRAIARNGSWAGDADESHHPFDCRGFHHHWWNGTLRGRHRHVYAQKHLGSDDWR